MSFEKAEGSKKKLLIERIRQIIAQLDLTFKCVLAIKPCPCLALKTFFAERFIRPSIPDSKWMMKVQQRKAFREKLEKLGGDLLLIFYAIIPSAQKTPKSPEKGTIAP